MPARSARSSAKTPATFEITTAMRPSRRPSATASISAWRLLPRPETNTPSRVWPVDSTVPNDETSPGVLQRGDASLVVMDGGFVSGNHFTDETGPAFATGGQFVEDACGRIGRRHDD